MRPCHFFPKCLTLVSALSNALYSSECCYCFLMFFAALQSLSFPPLKWHFSLFFRSKKSALAEAFLRRLASMLKAFLEPKNISEEQLLNWEQRDCPWSADESTLVSDPDRLASDVRESLCRKIDMMKLLRS